MRKGSTDHLALDINVESDPLVSSTDTDDDKGNYEFLNYTNYFIWKLEDLLPVCKKVWGNTNRLSIES